MVKLPRIICRKYAMKILIAASILALSLSAPALAQDAKPAGPPTVYAIHYKTGPAWKVGRPLREQAMGPHAAYMRKLFADGKMLAAGPTLNMDGPAPVADGGIILLKASSLDEAKALMAADPAVTGGLFLGEVRVWRPAFSTGEAVAPKS